MFSLDTLVTLQKAIAFAAMALLVIAAYSDIRTFRIPNLLVLAISALGASRLVLLGDPLSVIYAVIAGVLVFLIGLLLFSRRIVGGGDVKLLVATILLIRYRDFYEFFVFMTVLGALLSVGVIVFRNYGPPCVGPRPAAQVATIPPAVPYGVAIAGAGILTLLLQPLLYRYAISFGPSFLW